MRSFYYHIGPSFPESEDAVPTSLPVTSRLWSEQLSCDYFTHQPLDFLALLRCSRRADRVRMKHKRHPGRIVIQVSPGAAKAA
jgi:hypothetical protein